MDDIEKLESIANEKGATIYNICHRNAGWAVQWYEEKKQGDSDNWKDGLIIYKYYPSFAEAIKAEIKRLS